ncbi:unnamed protein product [Moneuplotes crassus]|uniref:Uncharacterized protein n=1 Tax=Euplotes crassus TaxID=5936 RepID=A0AAD1U4P3_EUPCR|nr:unnamed protein product [Moneuplotes crassus]
MRFPKCQHRNCREKAECYLIESGIYVCQGDKETEYSREESVRLVKEKPVRICLQVIDECRKGMMLLTEINGFQAPEEDYKALDISLKEQIYDIQKRLQEAIQDRKYFRLGLLLREARTIEEFLMDDPLFIKYAVNQIMKDAKAVVKKEKERSLELATKEISQQYNDLLCKTVKKLNERAKESKRKYEELQSDHDFYQKKSKVIVLSSSLFLVGAFLLYLFFQNFELKYSETGVSFRYNSRTPLSFQSSLKSELFDNESTISTQAATITHLQTEVNTITQNLLQAIKTPSALFEFISGMITTYSVQEVKALSNKIVGTEVYSEVQQRMILRLNDHKHFEFLKAIEPVPRSTRNKRS